MIHCHWRFSLPASYGRSLPPEQTVQWLWWDNDFDFEEVIIHGLPGLEPELERFVQSVRPYPRWRLNVDRQLRRMKSVAGRAVGMLGRVIRPR
jgi:hypothetical protein